MEPARRLPFEPEIESLLAQVRARLQEHYGSRFAGLVLHGSFARRTAGPESDIDLLVLLRDDFDYFQELRALVDLLYPLQLDHERNHLRPARGRRGLRGGHPPALPPRGPGGLHYPQRRDLPHLLRVFPGNGL